MSKADISIIIPCFNAEKYIQKCIDSVLPNLLSGDQLMVIDDGSTDRTSALIRKYKQKQLSLISHETNIGPSRSRNEGAQQASGDILFFLDVDTEITDQTLYTIRKFFMKDLQAGAVQCELRLSDQKLDSIGHFLTIFGFPYELGVNEAPEKFRKITPVFGAKSAGMAVRKKVFEEAGGFDEDYLIYGEDTDLSWRIWLGGYEINYLPGSVVYHRQRSSMTAQTKQRVYFEGSKNNLNYILKDAPINTALYMVPLHILGWILLSMKLFLQGEFQSAFVIYKGLGWNLLNGYRTLEKKQRIIRKKDVQVFGKITFRKLLQKGWRWFIHV
ncbi:glycosyltransferase family 2 protein [Candidatus Roizmanbacteria bacterium]|nr:MAG: glycosyltransferase family 2 protein [Candidatus Roizmanbacteria bacterium]